MKFSYLKFPAPKEADFFGKAVLRPIIPVTLSVNEKTIQYHALIDSGADFCIFDAEIGEYLGLDIKSGSKISFGGIQKSKKKAYGFFHSITISVGGWEYKTVVSFSYDIAGEGFGILGQHGFFNLFKVQFDFRKATIELKGKE